MVFYLCVKTADITFSFNTFGEQLYKLIGNSIEFFLFSSHTAKSSPIQARTAAFLGIRGQTIPRQCQPQSIVKEVFLQSFHFFQKHDAMKFSASLFLEKKNEI